MLGSQLIARMQPSVNPLVGEALYDTAGTHTFTVPDNVDSISIVCVGGGGTSSGRGGGGGGALAYRNNISVTPGASTNGDGGWRWQQQ